MYIYNVFTVYMHSHKYPRKYAFTHVQPHNHALTNTLTHSHTHTLTLTHSHSLTLTHSHSLTLTHSHKHTHTHTHTLTDVARELLMSFYDGKFYETLIQWTHCQYSEVQYNCAGVIGHLAINSECCLLCLFDLACFFLPSSSLINMYQYITCTCLICLFDLACFFLSSFSSLI